MGRNRFILVKGSMRNLCILVIILMFTNTNANSIIPPKIKNTDKYTFIVAGHAYGSHFGTNVGLHPQFVNKLEYIKNSGCDFMIFAGDFIRGLTGKWEVVESELKQFEIQPYFVMGNSELYNNNSIEKFINKYGNSFYSFDIKTERYIILNSQKSSRSITEDQIKFLKERVETLSDKNRNVFIFFHELLWNSNEIYKDVKSNRRSRYHNIIDKSNYWQRIHPILEKTKKPIYVIAGDLGGKPDSQPAFYDKWNNVTLIATGMGEIKDENYLKVNIHYGSINFELIPLNNKIKLNEINYYSVENMSKHYNPKDYLILLKIVRLVETESFKLGVFVGMIGISLLFGFIRLVRNN